MKHPFAIELGCALGVALSMAAMTAALAAQQLPSYKPVHQLPGPAILHSWGSDEMAALMRVWETNFTRMQPEIRFSDTLKGTETAQAALFAHVAEMAVMSRPILPLERHVMFRREHHLPLEIMVATGSADAADRSFALAILVNQSNPLSAVTLQQLDGIFGDQRTGAWDEKFIWHAEAGRGANRNLRTWGQLGLTGARANRPIHVYGYPVTIYSPTSGPMISFRKEVMEGGDIWNPDLQELPDSASIAAALSKDPDGIGYGCICDRGKQLKALAVAAKPGEKPVLLSEESVAMGNYPLSRPVYIYIDREPGQPVDPRVKEFLTYVLSRDGQQAVTAATGYLPLTPQLAMEQLQKIQ